MLGDRIRAIPFLLICSILGGMGKVPAWKAKLYAASAPGSDDPPELAEWKAKLYKAPERKRFDAKR